jgi:hypothetical protein
VDPYRLDEVADVWRRFADEAWVDVARANIPYRLAALRVVAKRARVTEAEVVAYMAEHESSVGVDEMQEVATRIGNIRHAAHAAHDALALRVPRYVPPWRSADAC